MFYTEKERDDMNKNSQLFFAEKAHEFPCCDVPTIKMCFECDPKSKCDLKSKGINFCNNKLEITKLFRLINKFNKEFVKN